MLIVVFESVEALAAELESMKLTDVIKRAEDDGVLAAAVDAAVNGDTPKESVIKLILSATEMAAVHC